MELHRRIERQIKRLATTEGSHRQFKHATKPGRVTVAGHPSEDVHPKTLNSILMQAGLKK